MALFTAPLKQTYLPLFKALVLALIVFSFFYAQMTYAQTTADAGTMLKNFARTVPQLMRLVTATAYVLGMWFVFQGVMALKDYGEQRTQQSHASLKAPIILMTVGTLLLYLPSSVTTGLSTFWSEPNPYGYVSSATDPWSSLIQNTYLIIQLIGTIAFIRGLIILTQLSQSGQPGTFGRGITFIIAGTLCINLYDFINTMDNTLGLGQ